MIKCNKSFTLTVSRYIEVKAKKEKKERKKERKKELNQHFVHTGNSSGQRAEICISSETRSQKLHNFFIRVPSKTL